MNELQSALRDYGEWILKKQLGIKTSESNSIQQPSLKRARELICDASLSDYQPQATHCKSIFSVVSDEVKCDFPLKILSTELNTDKDQDRSAMWNQFQEEALKVDSDFETFYNVFKKYAWYVPSSLSMPEISLFEQFKAIVALSHCFEKNEKEERLLLVGGDLPGIQDMVYTITSKGAAKSLRGRSFYIQLLCDVILQSVLRELDLPSANIIYSAGGNFKLLASVGDVEKLETLRKEINNRLLDGHKGELFAVIDWVELDVKDVNNAEAFSEKIGSLSEKLGISKRRWFAEQAKDRYNDIFKPLGRGGPTSDSSSEGEKNFCDVCHVEVDQETRKFNKVDGTTKCFQCDSFEDLTGILEKKYLVIENRLSLSNRQFTKLGKLSWNDVIKSLGYAINFVDKKPSEGKNLTIYKINDINFLDGELISDITYNFKFIGNVIPKMNDDDVKYMSEKYGERINKGEIRNTVVMAECHATGISRYAVLRMDVDGLSNIFRQKKNMLQTSALSSALSLFFDGWLNCICKEINEEWLKKLNEILTPKDYAKDAKLSYIIYSGGDDLFIVGPWDVMPMLAERIHNDLASYVNRGYVSSEKVENPCMTISAGITLCHSKFPIYQAADLAKEALDSRAKGREKKNAIDFLGVTIGWEEFEEVKKLAFDLANLIEAKKAPHSLLTLLKAVSESYQNELKKKEKSADEFIYGRWMWLLAYGISRMIERTKKTELKERICKINVDVSDIGKVKNWKMIKILGLPVRWAEYLIRNGG